MPTTQHRPHGALAGLPYGAFDGKTEAPAPSAAQVTQHRPHGALSGVLYGSFAGKTGAGTAPTLTAVDPVSGTALLLTWTGSADEYRLDGGVATALPSASPATISGLTPATPYVVQVRYLGGAWSNSITGYTDNTGTGGGSVPLQLSAITSLAAAVQVARAATAAMAAAVQRGRSATAGADAALRAARSASASVAAFLALPGNTLSASLAAAVQRQATATAGLTAALQARRTGTASLATAVARTAAAAASLQAQLAVARGASAALSVAIDGPTEPAMQASAPPSGRQTQAGTRPAQLGSAARGPLRSRTR